MAGAIGTFNDLSTVSGNLMSALSPASPPVAFSTPANTNIQFQAFVPAAEPAPQEFNFRAAAQGTPSAGFLSKGFSTAGAVLSMFDAVKNFNEGNGGDGLVDTSRSLLDTVALGGKIVGRPGLSPLGDVGAALDGARDIYHGYTENNRSLMLQGGTKELGAFLMLSAPVLAATGVGAPAALAAELAGAGLYYGTMAYQKKDEIGEAVGSFLQNVGEAEMQKDENELAAGKSLTDAISNGLSSISDSLNSGLKKLRDSLLGDAPAPTVEVPAPATAELPSTAPSVAETELPTVVVTASRPKDELAEFTPTVSRAESPVTPELPEVVVTAPAADELAEFTPTVSPATDELAEFTPTVSPATDDLTVNAPPAIDDLAEFTPTVTLADAPAAEELGEFVPTVTTEDLPTSYGSDVQPFNGEDLTEFVPTVTALDPPFAGGGEELTEYVPSFGSGSLGGDFSSPGFGDGFAPMSSGLDFSFSLPDFSSLDLNINFSGVGESGWFLGEEVYG